MERREGRAHGIKPVTILISSILQPAERSCLKKSDQEVVVFGRCCRPLGDGREWSVGGRPRSSGRSQLRGM